MNSDGGLRSSDGIGDLFTQETGNQPRQHFSFTRRERFIMPPQFGNFCLSQTSGTVALQRLLDGGQQILLTRWLGERLNGSCRHGPYSHRNIGMGSHEGDRNLSLVLSLFAVELKSTCAVPAD